MKEIDLYNQNPNLTELTEEDLISLCHLKGFKPNELEKLDLSNNKLTNINFIQENTPFINLKHLNLCWNVDITDISKLKYWPNLVYLDIRFIKINNQKKIIDLLKNLKKLNTLKLFYKIFTEYTLEELEKELSNIKNLYFNYNKW